MKHPGVGLVPTCNVVLIGLRQLALSRVNASLSDFRLTSSGLQAGVIDVADRAGGTAGKWRSGGHDGEWHYNVVAQGDGAARLPRYFLALAWERYKVQANPTPTDTPLFCWNSGLARLLDAA